MIALACGRGPWPRVPDAQRALAAAASAVSAAARCLSADRLTAPGAGGPRVRRLRRGRRAVGRAQHPAAGRLTIVDTMGGLNLRMGNYEHTPEDRMWDAVSDRGRAELVACAARRAPGATLTEGQKDKWAQRKAVEYMVAHPGTTLRRAVIKFADFWGLEREYAAGIAQGLYARRRWFG